MLPPSGRAKLPSGAVSAVFTAGRPMRSISEPRTGAEGMPPVVPPVVVPPVVPVVPEPPPPLLQAARPRLRMQRIWMLLVMAGPLFIGAPPHAQDRVSGARDRAGLELDHDR